MPYIDVSRETLYTQTLRGLIFSQVILQFKLFTNYEYQPDSIADSHIRTTSLDTPQDALRARKASSNQRDPHLSVRILSKTPGKRKGPCNCRNLKSRGGGGGIRTLVTGVSGETVFETAAFNHSATPPHGVQPTGFQSRLYKKGVTIKVPPG